MSFNTIKNEYNQLESDVKDMFKEFHAPQRLKQNEALVRRYIPFYMEHNKTFRLPKGNELLQESAEGVKVRLTYITMPVKHVNELVAFTRYEDNRGIYVDELGKAHADIVFQSGKYFKVVKDLEKEIEFLSGIVSKPAISPRALVDNNPEVVEETEDDSNDAELYSDYMENKQKYSKKEYAKLKGISVYKLNQIIKANEEV